LADIVLSCPEGTLVFKGAKPKTVHPLLVYADLLAKPSDRAADAAEEVRAHWLPWLGSWLLQNPKAKKALQAGLGSAAKKPPVDLGSFSKHATDE
jgi:hypothetical protein